MVVFFFKQKTAYEMRISDWSSDVCSSDLRKLFEVGERSIACAKVIQCDADTMRVQQFERSLDIFRPASQEYCFRDFQFQKMRGHLGSMQIAQQTFSKIVLAEFSSSRVQGDMSEVRSEEHTSELQSLMRISYAVFCLQKKNPRK